MKTSTLVNIAFYSGLLSIFAWPLSIIPITAMIAGFYAFLRFIEEPNKTGRPEAILGLTLGLVFLLVRIMN